MNKNDIKVEVTFGDVLDSGSWESFCEKYGINEWCINEGKADLSDTINISLRDAERWGIVDDN